MNESPHPGRGKEKILIYLGRVENLEEKRLFSEPFLVREHVSLWEEGGVFV